MSLDRFEVRSFYGIEMNKREWSGQFEESAATLHSRVCTNRSLFLSYIES